MLGDEFIWFGPEAVEETCVYWHELAIGTAWSSAGKLLSRRRRRSTVTRILLRILL